VKSGQATLKAPSLLQEEAGVFPPAMDPPTVTGAQGLLDRFLARFENRTLAAYTTDIEEFADFIGQPRTVAIAQLLTASPIGSRLWLLEYAVHLRARGRANSTVKRRLSTLHGLMQLALNLRLLDRAVQMPNEIEIRAAENERTDPHYLFPRHPDEPYRLDVQHYALRETLRANFVAPIREPRWVLDVGCGTGRWCVEVCDQLPGAVVVGLDLAAGEAPRREGEAPPQYWFVKGNVLQGLPFADGRFDFVHQRFLMAGVPLGAWLGVVVELVRVTRPGGWVELTEIPWVVEGAGPATEQLLALGREMAASRGLDGGRVVFDSLDGYLREAGLENVVRQEFSIPIGEWGGRVGSLMASDGRAAFLRLCEARQGRLRLSAEDARELIGRALGEWDGSRTSARCAIAFGQKPVARPTRRAGGTQP
jgi:SAM-dependent methyltransferase